MVVLSVWIYRLRVRAGVLEWGSVELMDTIQLTELNAAEVRQHPDLQFQAALSWLTSPNLPPVQQAVQVPSVIE